jgi:putative pantetheine hydrolase
MVNQDVPAAAAGRHNDLTDVAGVRVGQHQRRGRGWLTGTTVVLPPAGTVGSVDVRGGGPSTRETDALAATTLVDTVDAVVLSGGSSYGLSTAQGVMDWLAERKIGYPVGLRPEEVVPIVPAACLFDLGAGGSFANRPDASFGRAAADAAGTRAIRQGSVGAGTGAHAGSLKGGVGSASVVLASGITVAALVAINSGGSVFDPLTGELYGARYLLPGELPTLGPPTPAALEAARATRNDPGGNTLLAVVATDAALAQPECTRLAMAAHDGMARAVRPIHNMTDGDVAFSLATGVRPLPEEPIRSPEQPARPRPLLEQSKSGPPVEQAKPGSVPEQPQTTRIGGAATRPGQLSVLMAASADVVARAIVHAVVAATSTPGMTSYTERFL